jgi:hypothetical protein
MADIFREVDEDVRSDILARAWGKYSIVVLGLAVAIVVGTGAFVYLRHEKQAAAEAASAQYEAALALSRDNKADAAVAAFDAMAKSAPQGYQTLARLRGADELSLTNRDGAVKALDALAADASVNALMQGVARLRAALLRVDVADKAELEQRFGALLNGPFVNSAREWLALTALKRNDFELAGKYLDQIVVDSTAPANLRQRAEAFLSLVRGGGKFTPAEAAKPEPAKSQPVKPAQ